MPFGFIRSINSPWPMQIIQNNDYVALLFEQNSWLAVIPEFNAALPEAQ